MEKLTESNPKHGIIDIHMHVIPSVDDGADDFDVAIQMLQISYDEGIRRVVATPHSAAFDGWGASKRVRKQFQKLQEIVKNNGIDIELSLGAEVYIDRQEISRVLRKLKNGAYPIMDEHKTVLVEFSLSEDDYDDARICIDKLTNNGYAPIIAHAERYRFTTDQIYELKEMGCRIQVNYADIGDMEEYPAREKAMTMLNDRMVDYLATDAHNASTRSPEISSVLSFLYNHFPQEYIDSIVYMNS